MNYKKINIILIILALFFSGFYVGKYELGLEDNKVVSENYENFKFENLKGMIPENAKKARNANFDQSLYEAEKVLGIEKIKIKESQFNNIEDWYKLNQEQDFFWIRHFVINKKTQGANRISAFIVREKDFDVDLNNFQTIKFMDKENYLYDIALMNFSDNDLNTFVESIQIIQ